MRNAGCNTSACRTRMSLEGTTVHTIQPTPPQKIATRHTRCQKSHRGYRRARYDARSACHGSSGHSAKPQMPMITRHQFFGGRLKIETHIFMHEYPHMMRASGNRPWEDVKMLRTHTCTVGEKQGWETSVGLHYSFPLSHVARRAVGRNAGHPAKRHVA